MDLELLKKFYIVAEELNLTNAAKRLNTSHSAISRSMSLFEHYLKSDLLIRGRRGVELTPQAERLYAFAKQIMHEAESFEKYFHEKVDEVEGELKIMTTPYFGAEWLLPKLKKFTDDYPKVRIKLTLKNNKDIVVEETDVAITSASPRSSKLIQKHLFSSNIALFASQDYLKKYGVPQTVEDLDHHRLITYGGNIYNPYGKNDSWILNLEKQLNEPSRESFLEVDSLQGLVNSALLGFGIIEAPNDPSVLSSGLIRVLPKKRGPRFHVHYIFSNKRQKSRKINLLFDYLKSINT